METQGTEKKVLMDESSPATVPTHRSRIPPPKKRNMPLLVGIVVLVILIILSLIILFFFKGGDSQSKSGQKNAGFAKGSPTPTPGFYQKLTLDVREHRASLSAIDNDIKVIEQIFKDKPVVFSDILTPTPAQSPEWQAQKIEIAKARSDLEIVRRTTILNKLVPLITSTIKLPPLQKSQLINEANGNILYLASLRDIIAKQTDFQSLIANINALQYSYKSFAVIVPKIYIITIADRINVLGDAFTKTANKLIQKTEKLRSTKKDVTSVQKTLGNMLFMMGDAANRAETAVVITYPISFDGYPKNKSILNNAKGRLQKSSKNLSNAASDAQKISNSLEAIETGKTPQFNFFQLLFPNSQ